MACKILCLTKNSWNPTDKQTPSKNILWIFLLPELAAFYTLKYQDCKSDDDHQLCNKALKTSFLAQIASLTSWFHQSVLFSLLATTLSRFHPQLIKLLLFRTAIIPSQCPQKPLKVVECNLLPHIFVCQGLPFDPLSNTAPI